MKIEFLHLNSFGQFSDKFIDFFDAWDGNIEKNILLSGSNGSGKSTILKSIVFLWEAFLYWNKHHTTIPKNHISYNFLNEINGISMVLSNTLFIKGKVGILYGETAWCNQIKQKHQDIIWFSEEKVSYGHQLFLPLIALNHGFLYDTQKIIYFQNFDISNSLICSSMLNLSTQEQTPKRIQESIIRFLSVIESNELFEKRLTLFNSILVNKRIAHYENGISVFLENGNSHDIEKLSSGELYMLYTVLKLITWVTEGSILVLDDFCSNLCTSIIPEFCSIIENHINGQFICASNNILVWKRFDFCGKRIYLDK